MEEKSFSTLLLDLKELEAKICRVLSESQNFEIEFSILKQLKNCEDIIKACVQSLVNTHQETVKSIHNTVVVESKENGQVKDCNEVENSDTQNNGKQTANEGFSESLILDDGEIMMEVENVSGDKYIVENNVTISKTNSDLSHGDNITVLEDSSNFNIPIESKPVKTKIDSKGSNVGNKIKTKLKLSSRKSLLKITQTNIIKESYAEISNFQVKSDKPENLVSYECEKCEEKFDKKMSLQIHMLDHNKEKSITCSECGKSFTKQRTLKSHMKIHKISKCEECGKQVAFLKAHKFSVHSGERPHKCNICDKAYKRADLLKWHMHSHTGDKPYKCDVCEKCFDRPVTLKRHTQIHSDVIAFQCEVCSRTFSFQRSLKRHMQRIHGN